MKKEQIYFIIVVALIIGSIVVISLTKQNNSEIINPDIVQCISEKSTLYVSKTCSHCAKQKEILSNCLDQIEIIDCTSQIEICNQNGITQVPTWVIEGKKYAGTKTVYEIIELCGCAK